MKYSQKELIRFIIRDLIADARGPGGDHERAQLRILLPQRHTAQLDKFGWPICLKKGS